MRGERKERRKREKERETSLTSSQQLSKPEQDYKVVECTYIITVLQSLMSYEVEVNRFSEVLWLDFFFCYPGKRGWI